MTTACNSSGSGTSDETPPQIFQSGNLVLSACAVTACQVLTAAHLLQDVEHELAAPEACEAAAEAARDGARGPGRRFQRIRRPLLLCRLG